MIEIPPGFVPLRFRSAYLGFLGLAGLAATIAKVLFVLFLILLVVSGVRSAVQGRPPI